MTSLNQKIKKAHKSLDKLYLDLEKICINDATRIRYIEKAIANNEAKLRKYEQSLSRGALTS